MLAERSRIGLSSDAGFHPLLGFQNSTDGGVVIDLGNCAPVTRWFYGAYEVPPGRGPHEAPILEPSKLTAQSPPPKLHYHKSGMVSFSREGLATRLEHVEAIRVLESVQPKLVHIFSVLVRHPDRYRTSDLRGRDWSIHATGELTTLSLVGFLGRNPHPDAPVGQVVGVTLEEPQGSETTGVGARIRVGELDAWLALKIEPNRPFSDDTENVSVLAITGWHRESGTERLHEPAKMLALFNDPAATQR